MDITIVSPDEVERLAAVERLEHWKRGFSDGYRGNKRRVNDHSSYRAGYKAGAKCIARESEDGTPPVRSGRRR